MVSQTGVSKASVSRVGVSRPQVSGDVPDYSANVTAHFDLRASLRAVVGTAPTLTRTQTGTTVSYVNPNTGLLTFVAANVARFEQYGLLIEMGNTNDATKSNELDDASYATSNVTVTENSGGAPDGTSSSWILESTAGGIVGLIKTVAADTDSASFWFRKGGSNPTTGNTLVSNNGGGANTQEMAQPEWDRITLTGSAQANPSTCLIAFGATGSGETLEVAYFQAEDTMLSSFILTDGSAVSRGADTVDATFSDHPNLDNDFTVMYKGRLEDVTTNLQTLFSIFDMDVGFFRCDLVYSSGTITTPRVFFGGVGDVITSSVSLSADEDFTIFVRRTGTDFELTVNGVTETAVSIGTYDETNGEWRLGRNANGNEMHGWLKEVKTWNTYIPTADLPLLT